MKLPSRNQGNEVLIKLSEIKNTLEDMDKFFTRMLVAILCIWLPLALGLIYHLVTNHS